MLYAEGERRREAARVNELQPAQIPENRPPSPRSLPLIWGARHLEWMMRLTHGTSGSIPAFILLPQDIGSLNNYVSRTLRIPCAQCRSHRISEMGGRDNHFFTHRRLVLILSSFR